MKKRKLILLLTGITVVLAALTTAVVLLADRLAGEDELRIADTSPVIRASGQMDECFADIIFRPENSTLAITWEIEWTNRTGETVEDLVLRTWDGAFCDAACSPAAVDQVFDCTYGKQFNAGGIRLDGAWVDGELADAGFDDNAKTLLRIRTGPVRDAETKKIRVRIGLSVPELAYRYGRVGNIWQLGNILPVPGIWENGAWRTDEYWPVGSLPAGPCVNFDIRLQVPEGYAVFSSAPLEKNGTVYTGRLECARDAAFVIAGSGHVVYDEAGGVSITCYASSGEGAQKACEYAEKALACYAERYGGYPYPCFTCAECALPFAGESYPGLVMISKEKFSDDTALEEEIALQTARQWFGGIAGSDDAREPWQSAGLSGYARIRYKEKYEGADSARVYANRTAGEAMKTRIASDVTPGSPVIHFGDLTDYAIVVYDRGTAFMLACDELCGGRMDEFLRRYAEKFMFSSASRDDFAALYRMCFGEDILPLMEDYLDTLI